VLYLPYEGYGLRQIIKSSYELIAPYP